VECNGKLSCKTRTISFIFLLVKVMGINHAEYGNFRIEKI
jgi:hypothetical protein